MDARPNQAGVDILVGHERDDILRRCGVWVYDDGRTAEVGDDALIRHKPKKPRPQGRSFSVPRELFDHRLQISVSRITNAPCRGPSSFDLLVDLDAKVSVIFSGYNCVARNFCHRGLNFNRLVMVVLASHLAISLVFSVFSCFRGSSSHD